MNDGLRYVATNIPNPSEIANWLSRLNWSNPAVAAKKVEEFLSAAVARVEQEDDSGAAALVHAVLDCLDEKQDPRTGLWGSREDIEAGLAAAGKLCSFYGHVHRPMRALAALADEAIVGFAAAKADNAPSLSRLLRHVRATTEYRAEDIERVLGRTVITPRALESTTPSRINPLWMREPMGGSARFAASADVGIVITCYNLGEYLFETLDSIARQTLRELEVVIVNDGSTCRFTNAYIYQLEARGYRVINQANTGLAEARNNGIRALSSRFICCFDADDIMHPEWMERASGVLASSENAGYVSCYYTTFDNDHSVYRYNHPRYPEMLVENQTVGVSVFRRECWEQTGGYCPDFTGMEDWDFWLSVLDLGYRGELIPEVLFFYRTRIDSMYTQMRASGAYMANHALLLKRHRAAFQAHWPDVVQLRAERFVELLNTRAADAQLLAHQTTAIRQLEAARVYLEGQMKSWQRSATDAIARAGQIEREKQESVGQLKETREQLKESREQLKETREQLVPIRRSLAALEARVAQPGAIGRWLQNILLLASHVPGDAKWKNLGLGLRLLRTRTAKLVWRQQFDTAWYTETYTDVTRSGVSPMLHYLIHGHLEKRSPSAAFDSEFYLRRHPDVRAAGLNPLLHYALFGAHEKRTTAAPEVGAKRGARTRHFRSQRSTVSSAAPTPLVTVVIPCFNYGEHLAEAVRSSLEQTLGNVEVIVVEGGSTDGVTPATVRQLEESGLPRTSFLYRSEPHLTGDNRNCGIREARTKYICCLDADDAIKPPYLEVAVFFAETYGYDLVYPSSQAFGGDDLMWRLNDADARTITDYNQVSTVAVFRRSAWEEVNGFRDFGRTTEYVAEDWEFWVRLLRVGYRAKSIPQALHMYRVHTAGLWHGDRSSVDYQRTKIIEANSELLAREPVLKPLSPGANGWRPLLQPPSSPGAILLALPFVITGGAEKLFEMIIRSETAQGRKVIVITTLVLADTMKDAAEHFQTLTPYFYALPSLFGDEEAMWDDFVSYLIDQYSVDVIMIAGSDYMYHALPHLTSAFQKVGIVDQLFNQEVHFPTNRHYARYIDVTMVPSPAFATRMIDEFHEKPERIAVIPHGVDIPTLPDANTIADARRRSGLPKDWADCFLVGFFGRMSPEKAPTDFVEIVRNLRSEPNMRFVMTGEGPELEKVREAIERYGLKDRIFGPGFVDDPRDLMIAVDVVAVPSRLDGMPLVVMESQALAKPVVASAVGSIPVMIEDGRTGHLCPPGNIAAFAAKLRELSASPEARAQVGSAARESVTANHSAAAMIRRYEEAFEKARGMRTLVTQ